MRAGIVEAREEDKRPETDVPVGVPESRVGERRHHRRGRGTTNRSRGRGSDGVVNGTEVINSGFELLGTDRRLPLGFDRRRRTAGRACRLRSRTRSRTERDRRFVGLFAAVALGNATGNTPV